MALALFILEAKYTSHGVLAIGGIVAMLLGALMLIRSPLTGAGVSLGVALGVTLPFALLTIFLMRLVLRSRTWKQTTGREQLIGRAGGSHRARSRHAGGRRSVFRAWCACTANCGAPWRREAIPAGAQVRVVRVDGLTRARGAGGRAAAPRT